MILPGPERGSRRKSSPTAPSLATLASILLIGGLALGLAGALDLGFYFVPTHFGDNEWEFGTIIQFFDALPVVTMAMLLLAMGLRLREGQRLMRVFAVLSGLVALVMLAFLLLFALDVPVALAALKHPRAGGAPASDVVISGIKRGTFKTFLEGAGYLAAYLGLTIVMWKARPAPAGSD